MNRAVKPHKKSCDPLLVLVMHPYGPMAEFRVARHGQQVVLASSDRLLSATPDSPTAASLGAFRRNINKLSVPTLTRCAHANPFFVGPRDKRSLHPAWLHALQSTGRQGQLQVP